MILGLSTETFTLVHVILSLVGIVAGLFAVIVMIAGKRVGVWNFLFLMTTILTSVTGFFFPFKAFGPPHIVGVVSLVVLAIAIFALDIRALRGGWRPTYAILAVLALYLNVFVGIVQAFQKLPRLQVLAPTQTERPFIIVQAAALGLFTLLAILAAKRLPRPKMTPRDERRMARRKVGYDNGPRRPKDSP